METKKNIKTPTQKQLESLELAKHTDEFLLNGGKIQQIEPRTNDVERKEK